ncbi:hypothetical protein G3I40_12050, partial [Streptomyces sp. SID14478]|nr:hypothetical protein [Streptomyces sp. SID14478]
MTVLDPRVPWRVYVVHWAATVPVRVLGVALVVAACRPWETVQGMSRAVLFGAAVLFAVWAAPGLDRRPTLASAALTHRLLRHRTTV